MNSVNFWPMVFVFGLVVGSFLNAVIHRLPRGIGLSSPRRSFCPKCGRSLPWYENIPLLSWLVLRGKCSGCAARIPVRYPFVEALTAVVFVVLWWMFPPWVAGAYMVFAALLIAGTFIDLEHMILPDVLTLGGAVAGVILSAVVVGLQPEAMTWDERLRASLFGAGVGFAILFAVVELGKLAFGKKRLELESVEKVVIRVEGESVKLVIGGEDWVLGEVFYRKTDELVLDLTDGSKWRLRPDGVVRDGKLHGYEEADGWNGAVKSLVIPREAMGFGDVKFMLTLGAFLGWQGAVFSIVAGSCIGAVLGVLLLVFRRLGDAGRIPFGPYLAFGAALWIVAGPRLLSWYLGGF